MFKEGTSQVVWISPNPSSLVHKTSLITETCSSNAQSSFGLHQLPTFIVNSWVGLPLTLHAKLSTLAAQTAKLGNGHGCFSLGSLPTYANADIVVSTTQHQVVGWSFIGSNIMGRKYTKAMGWAVQMRESLLTKSNVLLYHTYNKSMVFIIQNPLKKKITA